MEQLNKFDLERIEKFRKMCENVYRRTMSESSYFHTKKDFLNTLHGDSASYYANEISVYKIQSQLTEIVNEYKDKFNK